ncbi:MAG: hypothetical protein SPF17_00590 [Candidatus Mucispirillum faecigallinarum]|nr:hypothetical protein [Candidatus Mucispirillum faecigallinarum]
MNKITFTNSITGETATVKVGFSWILFFFSSFFGIPLFLRKLYLFGVIMLILETTNIILVVFSESYYSYYYSELVFLMYLLQFGMFGLNIFLGIRGNKITALNYIKLGYKITNKEDYKINLVKESWNLPDTAFEKIG